MDATTEAVREQYLRFPYPAGPPTVRQGTDARLLMSLVDRGRPDGGPIRVLDAGCGRGVGLVGAAVLQPDVEFTGIDLCERSLDDARAAVAARGLGNVRLATVDLMTLEGLEVPPGGFDVILSSGVVHHLSDPATGLARLETVLAPHGVLSLMVYGTRGREALYRVVRAIDALVPRDRPLEERLAVGRRLVRERLGETFLAGPWDDLDSIEDAEFVDRYLNVNETSFDVDGVLDFVAGAGLRFLRWIDPEAWDPERLLPNGPTRDLARTRSPRERWRLVDELFWRPKLELLACRRQNGPRRAPAADGIDAEILCLSPEVSFVSETRRVRAGLREEALSVRVRRGEPLSAGPGPLAQALALIAGSEGPFVGSDLVRALGERGIDATTARAATLELVGREVLYRPHPTEL